MGRFALFPIFLPTTLWADGWRPLDGAELQTALEGQKLVHESGAWQEFRATGRTLYNAGEDSRGYWAVRDARYCGMWPPLDLWACYDMERNRDVIRFAGEASDITDGRYAE